MIRWFQNLYYDFVNGLQLKGNDDDGWMAKYLDDRGWVWGETRGEVIQRARERHLRS